MSSLYFLDLGENQLEETIPHEIGSIGGLRILSLHANSLSGVLPQSLGILKGLVRLDLSHNKLETNDRNLTRLTELLLYNSYLEGPIPSCLGNLKNLFRLDLTTNRLNGSIPREVFELPALSVYLDLSYNSLSGQLPTEVGSLANLNGLYLSENQLSGNIPHSIENCKSLEWLLLDQNSFEGTLPQSLENLKGLGVLNNLTSLSKLDVSFNNLQGEVPKGGVFGNEMNLSIDGNDKLCGGTPQLHLPPCYMFASEKKKRHLSKSLTITLISFSALVFSDSVVSLIQLINKKLRERQKSQIIFTTDEQYERVSYHALSNGTNGFSKANLVGQGSYGMVYKCTLRDQGTTVAVKVFNTKQSRTARSFVAECEALQRVCHRCLIKIITCCSSITHQGEEFKALVFEFMPNEDMSARVGDFGISRILPQSANRTQQNSTSTTGIRGTIIGYIAPEYGEGSFVSTQGDVYSLGILLLEMFTGRSPTDQMFNANNRTTRSRIQNCLVSVVALGISCSKKQPRERIPIQDAAIEMHAIRGDHLPEITEDVYEASVLEFFITHVRKLIGLSKVRRGRSPQRSLGAIQPSNLAASRSEGLICAAALWTIWKTRNDVVFNKKVMSSPAAIIRKTLMLIKTWHRLVKAKLSPMADEMINVMATSAY
ncbi:unnamed protein product [Miscanthus lutarioriparius]|uniref:Protein kinase domain-containing protein n=1 Tax=Miscanthus lutarioriparius TaxID=422564 RepID=A0A811PAJ5_9POAL|nr:unnamed protein product [Miscanthus lutarioriparius]